MPRPALRPLAAVALAVTLTASCPGVLFAQGIVVSGQANSTRTAPRLDQVMARWELDATGVSRLSATERAALEGWLARYTAALRAERAPAAGSSRVIMPAPGAPAAMDTIRPAPRPAPTPEPRATPQRPGRIALSFDPSPNAFEIVAVLDGGDRIATDDGSVWETYLPDRFSSAGWEVGQSIVVRSNPLPRQLSGPAFDVLLLNADTRTTVTARYAGRQTATDLEGTAPTEGLGVP